MPGPARRDPAPAHTMELPRLITVGEGNIGGLGGFLASLGPGGTASLVAGPAVRAAVGGRVEGSLRGAGMGWAWHRTARRNDAASIAAVQEGVAADGSSIIVGIGGGRAVDAAKMAAFNLGVPFASVPTAASHDGIASPFVSVRGSRPHSVTARAPLGVFVDIGIIRGAPRRLLASGCGDLVANIIAVRDWELGRDRAGEYYGRYAASLALMSAGIIMEGGGAPDERAVVEALISAGVASCIAGSSRPCSGAEHLFSHALDRIAPDAGLHGEKCGIGAIMMAKLQGQDWRGISGALRRAGAPTTAAEIGLGGAEVAEALAMAQGLRPERYTILREADTTREAALALAKATGVL